ncbi:hypothetical protein LCGC14_0535460 [marine sediment metagenome]|uniref:Uncharacterized protein n=1 Tax=marine sediment metagenome TaxID=412755 RepID=A0A0F9SCQ0_9ZZZZ
MIVQFHVSRQKAMYLAQQGFSVERQKHSGLVTIDIDLITDAELLKLGVARGNLPTPPRDLYAEMDGLKSIVDDLESRGA